MQIVVAPDSFKGSLSARQAAEAMKRGILICYPHADVQIVPMADGGEGTMQSLVDATDGQVLDLQVTGPLGNQVLAKYGVLGDGETCMIEMASASGLHHVPSERRNPLITTTYGTGELILHAIERGYKQFIIGLGGSATNDGGAGMLQALGVKLLDVNGEPIRFGGAALAELVKIDTSVFNGLIRDVTFTVASDVTNPLVGHTGASAVFGPQKGATPDMVKKLDDALIHFANIIEVSNSKRIHNLPGAGAAGGLGGAFHAFFNAQFIKGVELVAETVDLAKYVERADLVLTGEGQTDVQTKYGKTVIGVANVAKRFNKDVIVIAGSVGEGVEELYEYGILSVHSMMDRPMTLLQAMNNAEALLEKKTAQIVRTYFKA